MAIPGRPTFVELIGAAGAGKTTIARQIAASEPAAQIGLPLSRATSAAAQAAAMMPFVLPYLSEVPGTAWFSRYQVRGLGYLRAWRGSVSHAAPDVPSVVLDHGPLFWLATLDALGPPIVATPAFRRWWDAAVDEWAGLLDVVVWLDAPDDLLVRRVRARDQRHVLRGMDDDAAQLFLRRYRASYDLVLERVRRRSPAAVLCLRTDIDAPSALVLQVQQRLVESAS